MKEAIKHPGNPLAARLRGVYCVSLPDAAERRDNAAGELRRFGVESWEWHEGVPADAPEVLEAYLTGQVHFSPPCFRCGRESCGCENNFLTFPQVAVCLAYRSLWRRLVDVAEQDGDLFLLCEDDIAFTDRAREGAAFLAELLRQGDFHLDLPLLVRLGWAQGKEHDSAAPFVLEADRVKMSNPCYLLNAAMAKRLLEGHRQITHTVDVYTHREMNRQGGQYTLQPPIAYEHSWSTGRFESAIFPRKVREAYLRRGLPWWRRLGGLFRGRAAEGDRSGPRKRYELAPGLLVLDASASPEPAAVRGQLPPEVDLAVWCDDRGWLDRVGECALTVPEWGRFHAQLGLVRSLGERLADSPVGLRVFAPGEAFSQGWPPAAPEAWDRARLRENALFLLRWPEQIAGSSRAGQGGSLRHD